MARPLSAEERELVKTLRNRLTPDDLNEWYLDVVVKQSNDQAPLVLRERARELSTVLFEPTVEYRPSNPRYDTEACRVAANQFSKRVGVQARFYFGGIHASSPVYLYEDYIYSMELKLWMRKSGDEGEPRVVYNVMVSNAMHSPGLYSMELPFAFLQADDEHAKMHMVFDHVKYKSGRSKWSLAGVAAVFSNDMIEKLLQFSRKTVSEKEASPHGRGLGTGVLGSNNKLYARVG